MNETKKLKRSQDVRSGVRFCGNCKDRINDYGECDSCGEVVDIKTLGDDDSSAPDEDFAMHFTSPTFCVEVGPTKRTYHLHKQLLIAKSPYFETLLTTKVTPTEIAEGRVSLNTAVDTAGAFEMVVKYIYLADYEVSRDRDKEYKSLLHARVYVLAERLLMEDLKELVLEKLIQEMGSHRDTGKYLDSQHVVKLVKIVYEGTPCADTAGGDVARSPVLHSDEPICEKVDATFNENTYPFTLDEELAPSEPAVQTEGSSEVEFNEGSEIRNEERMRIVVARYASSRLDEMKKNPEFRALIQRNGDFAIDLVEATKSGTGVCSDEMERL